MELWNAGQTQELWTALRNKAATYARHRSTERPLTDQNRRRAIHLAHEGELSKAIQALQSDGVQAPITAIQEKLLQKHPQEPPDREVTFCTPLTFSQQVSSL